MLQRSGITRVGHGVSKGLVGILAQQLILEIDFRGQLATGRTEIDISRTLLVIHLKHDVVEVEVTRCGSVLEGKGPGSVHLQVLSVLGVFRLALVGVVVERFVVGLGGVAEIHHIGQIYTRQDAVAGHEAECHVVAVVVAAAYGRVIQSHEDEALVVANEAAVGLAGDGHVEPGVREGGIATEVGRGKCCTGNTHRLQLLALIVVAAVAREVETDVVTYGYINLIEHSANAIDVASVHLIYLSDIEYVISLAGSIGDGCLVHYTLHVLVIVVEVGVQPLVDIVLEGILHLALHLLSVLEIVVVFEIGFHKGH